MNKFSSHYFRHTFASIAIRQNIPLETIRELLGHSDYNTILKYATDSEKERYYEKVESDRIKYLQAQQWHKFPKGRELTASEQEYLVSVIMEWINRQINSNPVL